jgi:transposase InsO family protein
LEIKHRYTRGYRPQTNGKAERFWRTKEEELKEELLQYLYYYNHERPHQGLGGLSPVKFAEKCPRIT